MKGFIEVTHGNSRMSININHIISFGDTWILLTGREYEHSISETYEGIKELINQAQ